MPDIREELRTDRFSVASAQAFRSGINLMGFDQTADRVDGVNAARDYVTLHQNYAIRSVIAMASSTTTNYTGGGAKVELDLSAAPKKHRSYKLIATTRPLSEGSVALEDVPVEVVGAPEGVIVADAGLERRDDGVYVWVRSGNGATIIVR